MAESVTCEACGQDVPFKLSPYEDHGPSHSYLPLGQDGERAHTHSWGELQMAAARLHYADGSQTHIHHHLHGEPCNELCDLYPPIAAPAEPEPAPAPVPTHCDHGVPMQTDCGECIQAVRMGLKPLVSGRAGRESSQADS